MGHHVECHIEAESEWQSSKINCSLVSDSPMVFPEGDSELGAALLAEVSLAPLGLGAQRVEQAEEQLFRRNLRKSKSISTTRYLAN